MELLVAGGWMDESGECWLARVAPGEHERIHTFLPPKEHRVPRKGFTGAARVERGLVVCGFDAVWRFDADWRCTGRLHQPHFNDLHGVAVDERRGCVWIVNTGLDSLEVVGLDGRFRSRVGLTPGWFEATRQHGEVFPRDELPAALDAGWEPTRPIRRAEPEDSAYYSREAELPFHRRKVRDFMHANHVTLTSEGEPLVTLMARREIRSLHAFQAVAQVDGHPHDGIVRDDGVWFTTIDGRVWRTGLDGDASVVHDTARSAHVGWCRGLVVDDTWIAVGLTQVTGPTQYPWRSDPPERSESSVLWIDRGTGELVGRVDLTDRERVAKVFSLLPWSVS